MANSVQTSDKIVAVGFENLDNVGKNKQFILGVGVVKNGHIIKAELKMFLILRSLNEYPIKITGYSKNIVNNLAIRYDEFSSNLA